MLNNLPTYRGFAVIEMSGSVQFVLYDLDLTSGHPRREARLLAKSEIERKADDYIAKFGGCHVVAVGAELVN